MNKISIKCDDSKREKSIQRMKAYERKEYIDRVPAYFGIEARYMLKERGVGFIEYCGTPESNFHNQILNFKYRMENFEDDFLAREQIDVFPDFQNTTTASLFKEDCIVWSEEETPRIKHFIHTIEDLRKVTVPDMNSGVAGKKKRYISRMQELAKEYQVEINGNPIPIRVNMGWHETMFPGAIDMSGENLMIWMLEYPEDVNNFFKVMTDTCILYEKEFRQFTGINRMGVDGILDGAEMLSPNIFEEMIVPHYVRYYEAFPGNETHRGLHCCGDIAHLLKSIKEKLNITLLNGFGFCLDPHKMAEIVGGDFFYSGGLNPMTLWNGTEQEIKEEVKKYVDILGPYRTFMIGDGYNVVPGTSKEALNGIVRYLDEIGVPKKSKFKLKSGVAF